MAAGWALLGATVTAGGMALVTNVRAQEGPAPRPGGGAQPFPGAPGGPGQFPSGPGQFPGGPGSQGGPGAPGSPGMMNPPRPITGPSSVTANDRYVYVVQGNMLYQFDAGTLELRVQKQLPAPQQRDRGRRSDEGGGRPADGAPTPPR